VPQPSPSDSQLFVSDPADSFATEIVVDWPRSSAIEIPTDCWSVAESQGHGLLCGILNTLFRKARVIGTQIVIH